MENIKIGIGERIGHCNAYYALNPEDLKLLELGSKVSLMNKTWVVSKIDKKRGQYIAGKELKSGKPLQNLLSSLGKRLLNLKI